ncbi:MAG: hypothetical protein ACYDCL_06075 [Myxococcales bacterium]
MAIAASEFPLVQPHLYDAQTPPVVYLSGTLLMIGGLAIVQVHNRWERNWTLLVTLSGWMSLSLGLVRMFAASAYRAGAARTAPGVFTLIGALLFSAGAILAFQSYRPRPRR